MKKEVQYWDKKDYPNNFESEPKGNKEFIEAENEDAIFEEFYKKNNELRYCNGSYYKFTNYDDDVKYHEWRRNLSKERSFNLYYGNGVVD